MTSLRYYHLTRQVEHATNSPGHANADDDGAQSGSTNSSSLLESKSERSSSRTSFEDDDDDNDDGADSTSSEGKYKKRPSRRPHRKPSKQESSIEASDDDDMLIDSRMIAGCKRLSKLGVKYTVFRAEDILDMCAADLIMTSHDSYVRTSYPQCDYTLSEAAAFGKGAEIKKLNCKLAECMKGIPPFAQEKKAGSTSTSPPVTR